MRNVNARGIVLGLAGVLLAAGVRAQETTWTVDGHTSLAWWQVTQRLARLWGTTCPEDPYWQGGDGAPSVSVLGLAGEKVPDSVYARHSRRRAGTACAEAVGGSIAAGDTSGWQGVRGTIVLRAEALVSGLTMRDVYARKAVLETSRYPEIRFTIDSLTQIVGGETIHALAVGTFELHGQRQPMTVPIRASRASGGLRIQGQFVIPALALVEKYGMSRGALGLGIQKGIWDGIAVGVDVVLNPVAAAVATTR
jgi:hypothetical protein